MDFDQSRTRANVLRAFAGECQAIERYAISASKAKSFHLYGIEQAFAFTGRQEREHAEVFYNLLNGQPRENLVLSGTYPVGNESDPLALLRAAQHNEYQEYSVDYRAFADIARQENFAPIAAKFEAIAQIEQTHGARFGRFADLLEQGALFTAPEETEWMCLNCGHIHRGNSAPEQCPVCSHAQGYFLRGDLVPFR